MDLALGTIASQGSTPGLVGKTSPEPELYGANMTSESADDNYFIISSIESGVSVT